MRELCLVKTQPEWYLLPALSLSLLCFIFVSIESVVSFSYWSELWHKDIGTNWLNKIWSCKISLIRKCTKIYGNGAKFPLSNGIELDLGQWDQGQENRKLNHFEDGPLKKWVGQNFEPKIFCQVFFLGGVQLVSHLKAPWNENTGFYEGYRRDFSQ